MLRLRELLRDPAGIVKLAAGLSSSVRLSDVTGGDVTVGTSAFVRLPRKERFYRLIILKQEEMA